MATRRRLSAVPAPEEPVRESAPDLRDAVRTALAAMTWLKGSDEALKALALRQAEEIEAVLDRAREFTALGRVFAEDGDVDAFKRLQRLSAMCDAVKIVGWLGPQLQGVLRDLGGTPHGRKELTEAKPVGGRLAQLRAAAAAGAGEHDAAAVDPAAG